MCEKEDHEEYTKEEPISTYKARSCATKGSSNKDKVGREYRNFNVIFGGEKEYEILDENKTKAIVMKLNDFWCQCGS